MKSPSSNGLQTCPSRRIAELEQDYATFRRHLPDYVRNSEKRCSFIITGALVSKKSEPHSVSGQVRRNFALTAACQSSGSILAQAL
jgi:hypothetical protein